jgi:hypothetical protein
MIMRKRGVLVDEHPSCVAFMSKLQEVAQQHDRSMKYLARKFLILGMVSAGHLDEADLDVRRHD